MSDICKHYDVPSGRCNKLEELGSYEDLSCLWNGHCNYPFEMLTKEYTCKHFEKEFNNEQKK